MGRTTELAATVETAFYTEWHLQENTVILICQDKHQLVNNTELGEQTAKYLSPQAEQITQGTASALENQWELI